jgi:hypothetical protein
VPEAKAKVRKRHNAAIHAYLQWRDEHPKAKLNRQIQVFDAFVDGAMLNEMLNRKNVKHTV